MIDKYLESLIDDKDTLADNLIAKGISGLTGDETFTELVPEVLNIPSGGGSEGLYRVSSLEEMEDISDAQKGDLCIVYLNDMGTPDETTQFDMFTFPSEVILPEPVEMFEASFAAIDGETMIDFRISGFDNNCYISVNSEDKYLSAEYTSEDGLRFTFQSAKGNLPMPLPSPVQYEWGQNQETAFMFLQAGSINFEGIFTYDGEEWENTDINIYLNPLLMDPTNKAYTSNGIETGTFGNVSTPDDIREMANFIGRDMNFTTELTSLDQAYSWLDTKYALSTVQLDTSKVTNFSHVFRGSQNLKYIDLSKWDMSNATTLKYMFDGVGTNLSDEEETEIVFPTSDKMPGNGVLESDAYQGLFNGAHIKKLDFRQFPITDEITTLYLTFQNIRCKKIGTTEDCDLILPTNFKNVSNCQYLFGKRGAEEIDISGITFNSASAMAGIFCTDTGGNKGTLKSIKIKVPNIVTSLKRAFYGEDGLETIDWAGSDLSNVIDFSECFYTCSSLKRLDWKNFTINSDATFGFPFSQCRGLEYFDISSINETTSTTISKSIFTEGGGFLSYMPNLQFADIRGILLNRRTTTYTWKQSFTNIPNSCLIVVKDDTQKAYLQGKKPNLTNIMTASEYDALQS